MFEFLTDFLHNPFAIPITAIVVGISVPVISKLWFELERHREDTKLKRFMVERGMSADEIERVLAAKSPQDNQDRGTRKASRDHDRAVA